MISHFRMNLPHLFWFIFGCGALWKVGRLKPDAGSGMVRTIIDGPGDIGRIFKEEARGNGWLSPSGHGVVFGIPGEERGRFVAVAMQVWNMVEKWPRKKAALFEEVVVG